MSTGVTRLAPSPTGTLHLGNARTFLINWALARNLGWRIVLRIEDLDMPRVKSNAAQDAIEILAWLGIDFDEGPHFQSQDLEPYHRAMETLAAKKLIFACELTRGQIRQAASAPHVDDQELRFPPKLRPSDPTAFAFVRKVAHYRFVVPDEAISIEDQFAGVSIHNPFDEVGDFVIWTRLGMPAYQLAVVVDDARQGVTDVVRGDDLLSSAARQTLIYRALELTPPRWWHVPLVYGSDGHRLAKRHGDTHVDTYRRAGVKPERVVGLLAHWSGMADQPAELTADDFRRRLDPHTLTKSPVTFTQDHHAWLLQGCSF